MKVEQKLKALIKTTVYAILLGLVVATTLKLNALNNLYTMRRLTAGPKTNVVELISVKDRGKDIVLVIDACGSLLEFTAPRSHFKDDAFEVFVMEYVRKVCE